jgi:hypothetical protein
VLVAAGVWWVSLRSGAAELRRARAASSALWRRALRRPHRSPPWLVTRRAARTPSVRLSLPNAKRLGGFLPLLHPFGEFEDEASENSCELPRFQRAFRTLHRRHVKPYRQRSWNPYRGEFRWARVNDAPVIAAHRNSCCDCECNRIHALPTCSERPLTGDSGADASIPRVLQVVYDQLDFRCEIAVLCKHSLSDRGLSDRGQRNYSCNLSSAHRALPLVAAIRHAASATATAGQLCLRVSDSLRDRNVATDKSDAMMVAVASCWWIDGPQNELFMIKGCRERNIFIISPRWLAGPPSRLTLSQTRERGSIGLPRRCSRVTATRDEWITAGRHPKPHLWECVLAHNRSRIG